ncbi:Elongator complex protein 1 [Camellia lanceoleosa]|uniref:Elongator complex protein 1 n=1 Tax=Camellia lanceoleosa TaxID=1840588 RepID=A0ACC0GDP5_9ERIC|nr:Elongator complex protein 1 [Camellia lanceoleosa]
MQLAHELCEELQALGKHGEAAKIALEYCGDVNGGINLLVSARDWEEALRIAFMHWREDLISEVKNASLECANILIAKLQSEERSMNEFDNDTAAETSSSCSGMSAYTKGTRKSSAASISSTTSTKARDTRRQRNKGKIRAGSLVRRWLW